MSKCLITKLDAVVNDNTLPVLESMQQFTLDAITASGNETMSDAQKATLNHFFYQIGAIDNNALWAKIKLLLLPMVCNKNIAKSLINYTTNDLEGTPATPYWSFAANGGLTCSETTYNITLSDARFVGRSDEVSVVFATMASSFKSQGALRFGNRSEISIDFLSRLAGDGVRYYFSWRGASVYTTPSSYTFDIAGLRALSDRNLFKAIESTSDGVISLTDTTMSGAKEVQDYTSTTGTMQIRSGDFDLGAYVVAKGLSESEMDTILNAVKQLKVAFA